MYQFSIGVILDSFRCDRETALEKAAYRLMPHMGSCLRIN